MKNSDRFKSFRKTTWDERKKWAVYFLVSSDRYSPYLSNFLAEWFYNDKMHEEEFIKRFKKLIRNLKGYQ